MAPFRNFRAGRLAQLWRYYQAGFINTVFGFGVYSGLVYVGLNLYAAQVTAHLMGTAFNYVTYSRHVFTGAGPVKARFVAAYGVNYVVNLLFLAMFDLFIRSPYLAGFLATICASLTNYFALKHIVFTRRHEVV